jgi:copper(I)-binding protein
MTMQGGTEAMAMAYVEAIEIAANQPVSLGPTGLHVWLAGLEHPLAPGESFPLSLEFEHAGRQEVTVSVIEAAAPPMSGMKM